MGKTIYIGTIKEEKYGFRTDRGYEPSLSLECENGESVQLGNSNYYSEFSNMVGQRIKLTIEELEPLVEDEKCVFCGAINSREYDEQIEEDFCKDCGQMFAN
jgi:hypothetical protein